ETLNRISRVNRTMLNEMGREPTPEELARRTGVPARKVRLILESSRKPLSLETRIGEEGEHTLEEVGKRFAVTRERIRQIETKALRKLRHPLRGRALKAFVEN